VVGLTLAEHERVLLIRRLSRREPLEGGTLVSRGDCEFNVDGLALGNSRWESDGERAAVGFNAVADGEFGGLAVDFDVRDVKEAVCTLVAIFVNTVMQPIPSFSSIL
jgi:hypothetical protein